MAGAALAAGLAWLGAMGLRPGEPAWLRWLRMLAEHPVRAGLALALVLWALTPRRASLPDDPGHGTHEGL